MMGWKNGGVQDWTDIQGMEDMLCVDADARW